MDAAWRRVVSKLLSASAFKCPIDDENIRTLLSFDFFKELSPNVQKDISAIVKLVRCPEGKVLFRQGDPPGSCYVILRGRVGVFVKPEELVETDSRKGTPRAHQQEHTQEDHDTRSEVKWLPTREGFSVYHKNSKFGNQVGTFGNGHLFGELALTSDATRAATVLCLSQCDFLAVPKNDFALLIKRELMHENEEKTQFLNNHVPMYLELPNPEYWSNYFQVCNVDKDHIFLQQGEISNVSLWVLWDGSVDFWHTNCKHTTRSYWLQGEEDRTPTRDCRNPSSRSCPSRARRVGSSLVSGASFGSLPIEEPEMFTVRASSACKLLYLSNQAFKRYPQKQASAIHDYIVQSTAWHMTLIIQGQDAKNNLTATKTVSRGKLAGVKTHACHASRLAKLRQIIPLHTASAGPSSTSEAGQANLLAESSSMPSFSGSPSKQSGTNVGRYDKHARRPHSAGKTVVDLHSNCTWRPPSASKPTTSPSNSLYRPSSAGRLARASAHPDRRYLIDVSRPISPHAARHML